MMTSRERVSRAIEHMEPDRVPLDLGGSIVSGMQVSTVYLLRQALNLDPPGTPVRVTEPFQMLGEIKPDLWNALGVDVTSLSGTGTIFGFKVGNWKPWTTFDGTPVLVPGDFNTDPEPSGDILQYPQADKSARASGRMPKDGFYFDTIVRAEPVDDSKLRVEDNLEEFGPLADDEINHFAREAERLYSQTDKAIFLFVPGTSFGDIALVPGASLRQPKGIRDPEEWYMSTVYRRDHIYKIFEGQCEIGVGNLARLYEAVGNRVTVALTVATDFGLQSGTFLSPKSYRDLFQPFHKRLNDWVHKNTKWKTMIHSCGSAWVLMEDFIGAGFDVFNPVQCSAINMSPAQLKSAFGDSICFWGGGVDTQYTLPFGSPEEVRQEVRERINIFGPGGGFVFNTTHNVQAQTPVANVIAMYEAVREFGKYPL